MNRFARAPLWATPPRRRAAIRARAASWAYPRAKDQGLTIAGLERGQWRASQKKRRVMSELGHLRRFGHVRGTSAYPPLATEERPPKSAALKSWLVNEAQSHTLLLFKSKNKSFCGFQRE